MKMIDIRKKRVFYPLLFIILAGIIVFNIWNIIESSGNYKVKAYKVDGGWGYLIKYDRKVLFLQPFIPLLPGKHPFPSKKSALKTGNIMAKRIKEQKMPLLSPSDLKFLALDTVQFKP